MEFYELSRLQKRILDWKEFVKNSAPDMKIRQQTEECLLALQKIVAECWINKQIIPEQEARIQDLERKLESLNEESRIRVGGNTPLKKEEGLRLR